MNLTLIGAAIAAAIGFGAAWTYQGKQLAELELTHANERITMQAAARHAIERNTSAVIAAQNDAATRNIALRADADGARNAGNGLRLAAVAAQRHGRRKPSPFNLTKETHERPNHSTT